MNAAFIVNFWHIRDSTVEKSRLPVWQYYNGAHSLCEWKFPNASLDAMKNLSAVDQIDP